MDDPKKMKRDRKRINVGQAWELRYWTKKLGLSKEELKDKVKRLGTSVNKIRNSA